MSTILSLIVDLKKKAKQKKLRPFFRGREANPTFKFLSGFFTHSVFDRVLPLLHHHIMTLVDNGSPLK